jgi:hypothetical protein
MTDQPNDPRDRFRSLDRQDAPDLWSEATARAKATPARTSWLPRFGGGLAVAAVVVVGVIIGLQLAGPGSPTPGGPLPSPSDGDVVSASVVDGDYQLTISAPKATWGTDEAIEVEATLKYLGADESVELWGSGGGLIGFGLDEVAGNYDMSPAFNADCAMHTISASEPITSPFVKSGGYSPDDPGAAYWEAFFADPELHLSQGEWVVSASASFDAGETCTANPTYMAVEINLTVEGAGEPSAEPSESAEPSVEPSVEPTPELPQFACDMPISLTAAGSSLHPLLTQDIRVGTHDGFDRIVFEYDGGTPFLELDVAREPFVKDPSGEPMEVAGSLVYRITLTGATKWDLSGDPAVLVYDGPTDFEPGYPQIVQFVESGDFEATHSWYLGTNGSECLRAFTLNDPRRLVIDIQH